MERIVFSEECNSWDANFYFMGRLPYGNVAMLGVVYLERELDFDEIVRHVSKLSAGIGRLRQRIRPAPFNLVAPTWVDAKDFQVTNHVFRKELPVGSGAAEIMRTIDQIQSEPWNPCRPPWSFTVLSLPDDAAVGVLKVHHALADGMTAMALFTAGSEISIDARSAARSPLIAAFGTAAKTTATVIRQTWPKMVITPRAGEWRALIKGLQSTLRTPEQPGRPSRERKSCLFEVPASTWQAAARQRGGGTYDLYLAFSAAIWSDYFAALGGNRTLVRVNMVVDRRGNTTEQEGGNQIGVATVLIDTSEPILKDLSRVREAARHARQQLLGSQPTLLDLGHQLLPGRIRAELTLRQYSWIDVAATNVSAPAGIEVASVPVTKLFGYPLCTATPFALALVRYRDRFHIVVNADAGLVTDWNLLVKSVESALDSVGITASVQHGHVS